MSRYTVWDLTMVLERLAGWLVCPIAGHRWRDKMYNQVCRRCSFSRPRKR